MAQFLSSQPLEGLSTTKPPFFDVGESEVPKEEVEWNDEGLVKIMINNKAINMLQCALNPTEFHRVSRCNTAKEIWDMLEMKPEESIQDMYTRLNYIVTNLKALESKDLNTLKLEDLIGKLMTYEIEVQVDGGVEIVEKKKKNVAFKASNKKEESEDDASNDESSNEEDITKLISKEVKRFMKKNIKSKLAKRDEGESTKRSVKCYECNKMGHYRNECPKLKKGERKHKKSMKKKAFTATWSNDETSSMKSESSLENGVANLCFMAQEDSYNDEEVNSNFSSSINESSFEYSYDDLCKVLDCSMNDIKKLGNENIALTKTISLLRNEIESLLKQNEVLVKENPSLNGEIASLKNEESNNALKKENEDLKKGNEDLKKENEVLKKKAYDLENVISKFTLSKEKFDYILKSQKSIYDKGGIGFDYSKKQKTFKNSFVRASQSYHPNVTCYCCGANGHFAYVCPLKRLIAQGQWSRLNHFHSQLNPKTRESSLSKVKPAPGLEPALLQLFKSFGLLSLQTRLSMILMIICSY
ncbi:hypothetical protein SLEP1_g32246 [Rubroshorea leprosula]|uniref:CCHC-type domain-containing protein n=1 Tax=Rubroshorea leprosula TaxID=152421 RepID=A0AAV5KCX9_9ROSI|nr:hypothetical protein SLEP1_g32246 [Rubroshorea leprosula]